MKNKKKKIIFLLGFIVVFFALAALFNHYYTVQTAKVKVNMEVKVNREDVAKKDKVVKSGKIEEQFSIYYDEEGKEKWNEEYVENETYKSKVSNKKLDGEYKKLSFWIPVESKNIRVDFGTVNNEKIKIKNISISRRGKEDISSKDFINLISDKADTNINENNNIISIRTKSNDSYVVINDFDKVCSNVKGRPIYVNMVLIILAFVLGLITTYSLRNLKESIKFVKASFSNKDLIMNLAKNDFKQKYVCSYLGVIWGFIQPLITIAVYWFVFQVGFRSADVGNFPFILWFMAGIIPWFFFSEALGACTNVFMEYSYLVKKVLFKIETLPTIKIISTVFVHCFFVIFLVVVSSCYGYTPDLYTLQIFYYLFAMLVLVFSVTVFTSSVVLFFRDLTQIINIITNIGFWATPIGWNITMLPEFLQKIFKINPMFYIVTGYRDSFVEKVFFWNRPYHTLYFWLFCFVMLLIAVKMFNKLKPHFPEVI